MMNVTDALLVARRDDNGNVRLGLRVTDAERHTAWLNQSGGFDRDGAAQLHGMGIEAVVRKADTERWDFEAAIGEQQFVGWKQAEHPHCVGFKARNSDGGVPRPHAALPGELPRDPL